MASPYDTHKNFAYSTVATAPSPATSGTSLVVAAGQGTLFPTVPFNATIWPASSRPTTTNAEVVRVTAISTDTLTITRAQESSSARTVVVGDQIAATITAKSLTDIEGVWAYYSETYSTGVQTVAGTDVRMNGQTMINATNIANLSPFLESAVPNVTDFSVIGQHNTSSSQGAVAAIVNHNNGGTDGGQLFGIMSRGTFAAPTASQSGDSIFRFGGIGYQTGSLPSTFTGGDLGALTVTQDAASTATSAPVRVELGNISNKIIFYSSANATTPYLTSIQAVTGALGSEVFRIETVATNDDPSERTFQNRVATTDATVTTLQSLTIASAYSYHIEATVTARRTGGSGGTANDTASYKRIATVKDVSGTATLVGTVTSVHTAEDQAGWDCTIDVTGATARVRVTGAANNNITWHSTVKVYTLST